MKTFTFFCVVLFFLLFIANIVCLGSGVVLQKTTVSMAVDAVAYGVLTGWGIYLIAKA